MFLIRNRTGQSKKWELPRVNQKENQKWYIDHVTFSFYAFVFLASTEHLPPFYYLFHYTVFLIKCIFLSKLHRCGKVEIDDKKEY